MPFIENSPRYMLPGFEFSDFLRGAVRRSPVGDHVEISPRPGACLSRVTPHTSFVYPSNPLPLGSWYRGIWCAGGLPSLARNSKNLFRSEPSNVVRGALGGFVFSARAVYPLASAWPQSWKRSPPHIVGPVIMYGSRVAGLSRIASNYTRSREPLAGYAALTTPVYRACNCLHSPGVCLQLSAGLCMSVVVLLVVL